MTRTSFASMALTSALAFGLATPTLAALAVGTKAPAAIARATLGGKEFDFSLAEALKKGPVVLYFFPAAFTPGCTMEAHEFAEAVADFNAAGASIIGVSRDPIDKLNKFSVSECRSKFPVAADTDGKITTAYDAVLSKNPAYSDRTSYVIAPDGTIIYEYTNLDYAQHVTNTLKAVKDWKAAQNKN